MTEAFTTASHWFSSYKGSFLFIGCDKRNENAIRDARTGRDVSILEPRFFESSVSSRLIFPLPPFCSPGRKPLVELFHGFLVFDGERINPTGPWLVSRSRSGYREFWECSDSKMKPLWLTREGGGGLISRRELHAVVMRSVLGNRRKL